MNHAVVKQEAASSDVQLLQSPAEVSANDLLSSASDAGPAEKSEEFNGT